MQAQGTKSDTVRGNGRADRGGPVGSIGGAGGAPAMGMSRRGRPPATPAALVRAIRYIGRYRRLAFLAYGTLFIATAAQLAVPQLIQSIIDEVVKAFIATQVLALPASVQALASQRLGTTIPQMQSTQSGAT